MTIHADLDREILGVAPPEPTPFVFPAEYTPLPVSLGSLPEPVQLQQLGAIAFDLVQRGGPDTAFLTAYGLTLADMPALLALPAMQQAMVEAKRKVEEQATTNGFSLRARMVAESLLGDLFAMAKNPVTEPAIRLKIFELAARLARLDPASDKGAGRRSVTGMQVQLNFGGGIPGVQSVKATVVDAQPSNPQLSDDEDED